MTCLSAPAPPVSSSLESLFASPAALPTVPRVMQQLIASFGRDDVAIGTIAGQLAADPVLSAKTLRLANSAYFHVPRQVASVDDALRLLGFTMVRNLVLGLSMAAAFKAVRGLDLPQFWRHSQHTAVAARWLARTGGDDADLAYTVGLMHGLGQLVLHAAWPADMAALNRECHPLSRDRCAAESERLGCHHGQAGAELALRWNFPTPVTDALRAVPAPVQSGGGQRVAALVHVAAWRSRIDALRLPDAEAVATCPHDVARLAGLKLSWDGAGAGLGVEARGRAALLPPLSELGAGSDDLFA